MPKPTRTQSSLAVALVAVVVLGAIVISRPASNVTASPSTTTTAACASPRLVSDIEIGECYESKIRSATDEMNSRLRKESAYFHYRSLAQDWRVARETQSRFLAYVHDECFAQANPYRGGSIVPTLYGACELDFYDRRLTYLDQVITSFAKGGEAQRAS